MVPSVPNFMAIIYLYLPISPIFKKEVRSFLLNLPPLDFMLLFTFRVFHTNSRGVIIDFLGTQI